MPNCLKSWPIQISDFTKDETNLALIEEKIALLKLKTLTKLLQQKAGMTMA